MGLPKIGDPICSQGYLGCRRDHSKKTTAVANAVFPKFNINMHTLGQHEMLARLNGRTCRVVYNDGMFTLQDLETQTVYIISMGEEKKGEPDADQSRNCES